MKMWPAFFWSLITLEVLCAYINSKAPESMNSMETVLPCSTQQNILLLTYSFELVFSSNFFSNCKANILVMAPWGAVVWFSETWFSPPYYWKIPHIFKSIKKSVLTQELWSYEAFCFDFSTSAMIRNVGLLIGNRRTLDIIKQCLIGFPWRHFWDFTIQNICCKLLTLVMLILLTKYSRMIAYPFKNWSIFIL